MLLFLSTCILDPLPTYIIYYIFVHLFKWLLKVALLGAWIKTLHRASPEDGKSSQMRMMLSEFQIHLLTFSFHFCPILDV